MSIYDSRLLRDADVKIRDAMNRLHTELGSGSLAVGHDPGSIAIQCVRHMGKIAGLTIALAMLKEVEDEYSGRGDRKKSD